MRTEHDVAGPDEDDVEVADAGHLRDPAARGVSMIVGCDRATRLDAWTHLCMGMSAAGSMEPLREPVRAIAFLSAQHPAREALRTTFERYRVEAPEHFTYDFEDPVRRPDLTAKYKLRGVQIASHLLKNAPSELLRRTGIDGLFHQVS